MHEKIVSKPVETTPCNVITNTAYMMVLATELMLREVERLLSMENARIVKEKKRKFNMFLDHTKKALFFAEGVTEDIFEVDAENKWKNVPIWQEEANELARLVLLYADRSVNVDSVEKIFKFIREIPGEGIITEDVLKNFYLKKL